MDAFRLYGRGYCGRGRQFRRAWPHPATEPGLRTGQHPAQRRLLAAQRQKQDRSAAHPLSELQREFPTGPAVFVSGRLSDPSADALPWPGISAAVAVGLFEMGIPFVLWSRALKLSSSVARIGTLSFLVPFLSLFWVSLVLREPIAPSTLAGLACIVSGTFFQQRAANHRSPRQAREKNTAPQTAAAAIRNSK